MANELICGLTSSLLAVRRRVDGHKFFFAQSLSSIFFAVQCGSRRAIFNVSPQHLGVRRTSKIPARLVETIVCHGQLFSARLAVSLTLSRVCFLIQYETVCAVVLLPFPCCAPSLTAAVIRFTPFLFHGSLLLLAVLAGLLAHAPTTVMLFTYLVILQLNELLIPQVRCLSRTHFHQVFSTGRVGYFVASPKNNYKVSSIADRSHIPSCKRPTPSEAQHACSRLLPTSP